MENNIIVEITDCIMQIRINRPEKKNALTRTMYSAISQALIRADEDKKVHVIVLTGSEDCFTAGNDLADFLDTPGEHRDQPMLQFISILPFVKKPIVAAVNGVAVGVGVTMLLHCDLVYAGDNTQFQLPFVNLGLTPEAGSTLLLPLLTGYQRAAELLLLGEAFTAEQALSLGIVNKVCKNEVTLQNAIATAKKLTAQPNSAICMTKSLMKRVHKNELRTCIDEETRLFLSRLESPEAKEAFQAFVEKRKPNFSQFD